MAFISRSEVANFFNEEFYLNNNPDVQQAVANGTFESGLDHFLDFGISEGRAPSQSLVFFSNSSYLRNNSDVQPEVEAGLFDSGLDHFLSFGIDQSEVQARINEGGTGYEFYNEQYYINNNPDVEQAVNAGTFDSGLGHFLRFGLDEGLTQGRGAPSEALSFFTEENYLQQNADVQNAIDQGVFDSGLEHFLRFGVNELEARSGTGYDFFNRRSYIQENPDVERAVNKGTLDSALEHYVKFGFEEGRDGLFKISADNNLVSDEGETLTFTVESINGGSVGRDTEVTFSLAGDIDLDDIAGDSLTRTGTIEAGSNSVSFSVELAQDLATEGLESIAASASVLGDENLETDQSIIQDTSTSPTVEITSDKTTVNETDNSDLSFTIETENVSEGETLDLSFSGDIDNEDVEGNLPETTTVDANGTATVNLSFLADETEEGAETFNLEASIGETAVASPEVTVEDTSTPEVALDGLSSVGSPPATPEDNSDLDAGSGSLTYVDSVGTGNNVEIANFGADDQIEFQGGVTAEDVSFQESGGNTQFEIDNGAGTVSRITLVGVTSGAFSVSGFNEALGEGDGNEVTFAM